MVENSNKAELREGSRNDLYTVLPTVFDSVDDAVKQLKLDRRHKWFEFMGEVGCCPNFFFRETIIKPGTNSGELSLVIITFGIRQASVNSVALNRIERD